jgi:hypothetical protein
MREFAAPPPPKSLSYSLHLHLPLLLHGPGIRYVPASIPVLDLSTLILAPGLNIKLFYIYIFVEIK